MDELSSWTLQQSEKAAWGRRLVFGLVSYGSKQVYIVLGRQVLTQTHLNTLKFQR